jgi:hypothetical protein
MASHCFSWPKNCPALLAMKSRTSMDSEPLLAGSVPGYLLNQALDHHRTGPQPAGVYYHRTIFSLWLMPEIPLRHDDRADRPRIAW